MMRGQIKIKFNLLNLFNDALCTVQITSSYDTINMNDKMFELWNVAFCINLSKLSVGFVLQGPIATLCTTSLTLSISTFCPHSCIYVFCVGLRTNSDYFPTQY